MAADVMADAEEDEEEEEEAFYKPWLSRTSRKLSSRMCCD